MKLMKWHERPENAGKGHYFNFIEKTVLFEG